jgi:hypothetical protein
VDEVQAAAADLRARLGVLDRALTELADRVTRVAAGAPPPERAAPEAAEPPAPEAAEPPAPEAAEPPASPTPPAAPRPAAPPAAAAPPAPAAPSADAEGARLVALELALSGKSREETDRYVAEHFDVPDRGALLDEVFATAGQ